MVYVFKTEKELEEIRADQMLGDYLKMFIAASIVVGIMALVYLNF